MNADETQVFGCIYLAQNDDRTYRTAELTTHDGTDLSNVDATVAFWFASRRGRTGSSEPCSMRCSVGCATTGRSSDR